MSFETLSNWRSEKKLDTEKVGNVVIKCKRFPQKQSKPIPKTTYKRNVDPSLKSNKPPLNQKKIVVAKQQPQPQEQKPAKKVLQRNSYGTALNKSEFEIFTEEKENHYEKKRKNQASDRFTTTLVRINSKSQNWSRDAQYLSNVHYFSRYGTDEDLFIEEKKFLANEAVEHTKALQELLSEMENEKLNSIFYKKWKNRHKSREHIKRRNGKEQNRANQELKQYYKKTIPSRRYRMSRFYYFFLRYKVRQSNRPFHIIRRDQDSWIKPKLVQLKKIQQNSHSSEKSENFNTETTPVHRISRVNAINTINPSFESTWWRKSVVIEESNSSKQSQVSIGDITCC